MISDTLKDLFHLVRTRLGAPIRPIQLTDDMLCDLLKLAMGDYTQHLQNFITQSNWMNLYGKNQNMDPTELAYAISLRTMALSEQISYYFSKEVGLQQRGSFELKKDYFPIERGKQVYIVPSGREINQVMWCTPSTTKAALYGNLGVDNGMFGGIAQMGNTTNWMGVNSFYFAGMYDVALTAANLKYVNSMFRSDLVYKVTAGPDGTHLIHLLSTPGSKNVTGVAMDDANLNGYGWDNYIGCYVWYTYYDTVGLSDGEIDECRKQNKGVIISPDTIPFSKLDFELLNEPAQQTVRQLLVAESMITLGIVRGTNSGKVSIPEAELQLDYQMLLDMGKTEKQTALENFDKYLEQLLPYNMLKNQADMLDSTKKVLDGTPLGIYVK